MKTLRKILWWIPAIVMMYVVFGFSTDTGEESSGLSMRVGTAVVRTVDDIFNLNMTEAQIMDRSEDMQLIIRKGAHMTEYFILCLLVLLAVTKSVRVYGRARLLFAGGIVFLYACTDEIHQYFVPGRTGKFTDVLIDCVGAAIALAVVGLIWHLRRRKRAQ